ncbi:sensor histidine kinase [Sphingomonas sp. GB1N7]|uniref:sensor histidine kinase n=1 Tax=Parasphingomonas caseinilytica TaxID=3096158 RepID=UPI002FC870CE
MAALPKASSLFSRFAIAISGLALGAALLLFLVTSQVVTAASDAELARSVDTEIAALADIYVSGGQGELMTRIRDRLTFMQDGPDRIYYLLTDAAGRRIVGNMSRWPILSAENSQRGFVLLDGNTPVFARSTLLAPDLRLVAAREFGSRTVLLKRLQTAFIIAAAAILAAAFLTAWVSTKRLRRRVEQINAAFVAIEEGELKHHIPGITTDDEFGLLARHADRLCGRLATLIAAQREVTDQVAHEIRTPLMHVENRLLKLIDRSVDPVQAALLVEARTETRAISNMLNSLLDIAANNARRGDRTGFERFDLSEIATHVVELYADSAEDHKLDLRAVITPGVSMAGDAMQITRLLSNLLDNAFKYVPSGGGIVLKVQPGPIIVVQDNGPGVAEALRTRIFDRFQRAHDGIANGHGLGLTLATAIAGRHGLSIRCEDAGPGAAFIVEKEKQL